MSIDINMLTNMLLALRDNKNLSFYCEKRSGNIVKIRNKNRCRYKRICIRANLIYIFFLHSLNTRPNTKITTKFILALET